MVVLVETELVFNVPLDTKWVAWWRNGRALDLRSRGRGFDSRVGAQLRNDRGQVAHTRLPRRRQSSLLYGVVKPDTFTFTKMDNFGDYLPSQSLGYSAEETTLS